MSDCYVQTDIKEFILGGKAEFSIINSNSNKGYKYHVNDNKEHNIWFVAVQVGASFQYAGFIRKDKSTGSYVYQKGNKGTMEATDDPIKGLIWVLAHAENMNPIIKVIHHGRCSVCGRPLTDEVSIVRGIGPVCYDRVKARGL